MKYIVTSAFATQAESINFANSCAEVRISVAAEFAGQASPQEKFVTADGSRAIKGDAARKGNFALIAHTFFSACYARFGVFIGGRMWDSRRAT
ncbi:hypothetical protein [Leclercia tamurae]|uniref:Uncharacterized protein n=1 Tax=Leclercia tamurae TaxID=2926467 RepID=A0ABT2RAK1_9ENTR|nr:hypothetical protein [Leclercia tamurae]MCU6677897.1 hypothetical protein [Leclercia tamurae]